MMLYQNVSVIFSLENLETIQSVTATADQLYCQLIQVAHPGKKPEELPSFPMLARTEVDVWLLYIMCDLVMIISRTVMQMSTYPLQIVQENAWHKLQGAETSMQVPMRWVVLCSHMYTPVGSKHLTTLIEHHLQRAWRWYQVRKWYHYRGHQFYRFVFVHFTLLV